LSAYINNSGCTFFFFEEKQLLHLNDARLPVSQVEKTSLPQASRPGRGHDIKTSCKATTRDIFACSQLVLLEHSTMWPDVHTTDQAVTMWPDVLPKTSLGYYSSTTRQFIFR